MSPIAKMFIGVILMAVSVLVVVATLGQPWGTPFNLLYSFLTVLTGVVPALVFLIGVFIVWLEWDELRIERELAKEEAKPKAKRTKK